jgi:glycosyltransferase involved in cell wall biosynthesis
MATGLPALGSAVPGIAEVLGELAATWTLPTTDTQRWAERLALLAAGDPLLLDETGRAARRIAFDKFSPAAYLSNLDGLYRELVGSAL